VSNVSACDTVIKGFGLVRDKDGKPKIDDPKNLPIEIYNMLTDEEKISFPRDGAYRVGGDER
jgi:hypothetical protein